MLFRSPDTALVSEFEGYGIDGKKIRVSGIPTRSEFATRREMADAKKAFGYEQTGPFQMGEDGLLRSGVIIRHLILPGCVDNSKRVIDFVAGHFQPGEVLFSLMRQYLPCGRVSGEEFPELCRRVSDSEYQEVEDYLFSSSIEDGFVQDPESASQAFIPHFDCSGV